MRVLNSISAWSLPLVLLITAAPPAAADPAATPEASSSSANPQTPQATAANPQTAQPTPEAVADAAERYQRGLAVYAEGEYLLALVEFERAYQLAPNYRVLYNIGQVRIQLARYSKAREALEEYLKQGGDEINAERKRAVMADLKMLEERTASLNVISNEPGADIVLDGVIVGTSPLAHPLIVDAGEHNVEIRKPGFYGKSSFLTLAGRDESQVNLDLTKIPEAKAGPRVFVERHPSAPNHSLMWIGWATTGALALGAGVVGYLGVTKANDLESMRTDYGVTAKELDNTKSSARTLFMISDITGAAAVIAGGVSLYLTLSNSGGQSEAPAEKTPKAAPPPRVGFSVGPGSANVHGTF